MSKFIVLAVLLSAFFVYGCQTAPANRAGVEDARVLMKCSTCGMEFTSKAAAIEHMAEHPEHEMANNNAPLIKCSTCGVVFTSAASLKKHQQENPDHKIAPLIRCSTCGMEFTSPDTWKDHLKKHPDHQSE